MTCTPESCYMSGKISPEAGWKLDGLRYVLDAGLPLCREHRETIQRAVLKKEEVRQHKNDRTPGEEG